uniref:Pituitary tumor-transforming gene 1 protein-interacting protein n=1 Tax=Falco tinnunculus TaxID=100819 RepID=A0A8C4V7K3_FALTI
MASVRLWPLWLRSLVLLWGRAGMGLGLGLAPPTATAPPAPAQACSEFSQRSCEECLKNVSCLWCYTNNTCIDYPVRSILPPSSLCSLSNARWGVCWINFEALIIAIAVVAGLILVSVAVCCCYCCYCRRRSRSKPDEEEEWLARKKEERRLQSLQRKHERKLKHDEIRKKYAETSCFMSSRSNQVQFPTDACLLSPEHLIPSLSYSCSLPALTLTLGERKYAGWGVCLGWALIY